MAPTSDPQPGHPQIHTLDKAFTNASALAGWLEYLAHPEEHRGPRLVTDFDLGSQSEPFEVREASYSRQVDAGSVLRDLTIPEFFAAADILSGQDIVSMGEAVDSVEELRHRHDGTRGPHGDTADVYERLDTNLGIALPNWTTPAGEQVASVYDDMHIWYTRRTEDLFVVSKRLVEFAATIATARKNLNELMGKLVDALRQHTEENPRKTRGTTRSFPSSGRSSDSASVRWIPPELLRCFSRISSAKRQSGRKPVPNRVG